MRIGTRGSPLALAQAHEVRDKLERAWPELAGGVEVVVIQTRGDQILDRPLADIGGKGLFTEELEAQLRDGRVDVAVHSMKDLPTWLPEGLDVPCMLPREDPRDAFLSHDGVTLEHLPSGAVIGTASLRRQAQVASIRPDLQVVTLRGNVQTRMRKLSEGVVQGTLLAMAGLNRLGLQAHVAEVFEPSVMLPAVAQGAIGVECRVNDDQTRQLLAKIHCHDTCTAVVAERSLLAELDGSCRTPIAGYCQLTRDGLWLRGLVERDGKLHRAELAGPTDDPIGLGVEVASMLRPR